MNEKLGETPVKTIENCQPGDVFELANSTDLAKFEDEVAERFILDNDLADKHYVTWGFRKKLIDLIRPDDYYGPIKNINLCVIPDAYDRMFDFKERGKRYQGHKHPHVRTKYPEKAKEMTIGFDMTFETRKGTYSTEVYYVPTAENTTSGERATSNTGGVINRYMAIPEIIPPAGTETSISISAARTIGSETVRRCVPPQTI